MEIKQNDATDLRPEGSRLLDAPSVTMDIAEFVRQIKNEESWKTGDRNAITVYKTDGMRIVVMALHKDAELKRHKADGILCVQVIDGRINFMTDESSVELETNQMIALHKGLYHSVKAIKESVFMLTITTSSDK